MMICITNCQKVISSCPPIVNYTATEQQELEKTLKEVNRPIINRFIIDYGNLRENLRICNK